MPRTCRHRHDAGRSGSRVASQARARQWLRDCAGAATPALAQGGDPRAFQALVVKYQRRIAQFSERLEEIANRHGVTIFDVYTITKDELPSHPEYFSIDGFHPSDDGYELWATQMWPTLARVIGAPE